MFKSAFLKRLRFAPESRLPEVVHVEVAMGFEPVFVGLDG